jgi:hypothetical protein
MHQMRPLRPLQRSQAHREIRAQGKHDEMEGTAYGISYRLQNTPSERQTEQYDDDKNRLIRILHDILDLMTRKPGA